MSQFERGLRNLYLTENNGHATDSVIVRPPLQGRKNGLIDPLLEVVHYVLARLGVFGFDSASEKDHS